MRTTLALLLAALPLAAHAADPDNAAPQFRFAVTKPMTFTVKQTTTVLDDDEHGIPHRLVATSSTTGTLAPVESGGYRMTYNPGDFLIKVDGFTALDALSQAMKKATVTVDLDANGRATKVSGLEAVQTAIGEDQVARRLLGRDLAAVYRSNWNDNLLIAAHPSAVGSTWQSDRETPARRWTVASADACGNTHCVEVQSSWEADSKKLVSEANRLAQPGAIPLADAQLSVRWNLFVDPATLLPYHEARRNSSFMLRELDRKKLELRKSRTEEVDWTWDAAR